MSLAACLAKLEALLATSQGTVMAISPNNVLIRYQTRAIWTSHGAGKEEGAVFQSERWPPRRKTSESEKHRHHSRANTIDSAPTTDSAWTVACLVPFECNIACTMVSKWRLCSMWAVRTLRIPVRNSCIPAGLRMP